MCQDESRESRDDAAKFIEEYKQRTPMGNERRAISYEKFLEGGEINEDTI